jgi:deoxycytidylate deaminase
MEKNFYPYLPEGKIILYVPESDPFMQEAARMRTTQSSDHKHPTGAVVVKGGKIIGEGANQSRLKNRALIKLHSKYCIRKMLGVPSGKYYFLCPGCATNKQHAESRAVADALQKGNDTQDADLYLYGHWWACKPCWDTMISAGIKNVYLLEKSEQFFKA